MIRILAPSPSFFLSLSLFLSTSFTPSLACTLSPRTAPVVCLGGLETLSFGYISVSAPLKGFQHPLSSSFSLSLILAAEQARRHIHLLHLRAFSFFLSCFFLKGERLANFSFTIWALTPLKKHCTCVSRLTGCSSLKFFPFWPWRHECVPQRSIISWLYDPVRLNRSHLKKLKFVYSCFNAERQQM